MERSRAFYAPHVEVFSPVPNGRIGFVVEAHQTGLSLNVTLSFLKNYMCTRSKVWALRHNSLRDFRYLL